MKITDRFIGDHKTFRKLISDLDRLPKAVEDAEHRRLVRLAELFVDHLMLHAWGEETFYYPQIAAPGGNIDPTTHERLDQEHAEVDVLARQVETEARKPAGGAWREYYDQFKSELLKHMNEEEQTLFPQSE